MHPLFFHCVFLPEISGRSLSEPGQKLPVCCSLPLDFGGRSSLTSSHSENTDSHRLHDPSEKILRNITPLPDIKALPFLPARRRSSTCSLCHLHIRNTLPDHPSSISASKKSASSGKNPRRHALISQSLRWHYPNQVRSKIYLPLSLSHKLPLALFFSVFQYSTHLSRCQTSLPGRKNPGIYHNKSYFEISSIRRSSSAVNGAQWIAFTLSRICCGLEAPIRTLVTSLC